MKQPELQKNTFFRKGANLMIAAGSFIINMLGATILVAAFKYLEVKTDQPIFGLAGNLGLLAIMLVITGTLSLYIEDHPPKQPEGSAAKQAWKIAMLVIFGLNICVGLLFVLWLARDLVAALTEAYPNL